MSWSRWSSFLNCIGRDVEWDLFLLSLSDWERFAELISVHHLILIFGWIQCIVACQSPKINENKKKLAGFLCKKTFSSILEEFPPEPWRRMFNSSVIPYWQHSPCSAGHPFIKQLWSDGSSPKACEKYILQFIIFININHINFKFWWLFLLTKINYENTRYPNCRIDKHPGISWCLLL